VRVLLKRLPEKVLQMIVLKIARASRTIGTCEVGRTWLESGLTSHWSGFVRAIGGLYTRR
jgi:hypothetical protein